VLAQPGLAGVLLLAPPVVIVSRGMTGIPHTRESAAARASRRERSSSIRRALFWTTSERYVGLLLNFVLIVVLSRLLTPGEIGIMQLGWVALMLAEPLRDFGMGSYLVQKRDLDPTDARAAFTFALLFSALPALALFSGAGAVADFYGEPGLRAFLRVVAPTLVLAPFAAVPLALMRREMRFGNLAFINVSCALLNVVTIAALVVLGFGYMSPAWAAWVWSVAFIVLALWVRPDPSPFRFTLHGWRPILSFAGYGMVPQLLQRLVDFLPSLVLGRLISMQALGFFDRATKISELPEKVGTIGVQSLALPGFANQARSGGSLKQAYLSSVEHVAAVQWPGLLLLFLLAEPIVQVLLGAQWTPVVALVRLIALAFLANFSQILSNAVLIAAGHVRDTMLIALLVLPIMTLLFAVASLQGLVAAAASLIAICLVRAAISNAFVCRRLAIGGSEIARPLLRSLAVGAMAMLGPLVIVALNGFDLHVGVAAAIAIGAATVPGWLFGLRLTNHPFGSEIRRVVQGLKRVRL
jgi:O-antigen/teichoic acid export membrane protein